MAFDPNRGGNGGGFGSYSNPYSPAPQNTNKGNGSNGLIIFLLVVLVLGGVCGAGYYFYSSSSKPQTPNNSNNQSVIDNNTMTEVEIFDVKVD